MTKALFPGPTLLWSDDRCELEGRFYARVPLLLDAQGNVVDAPSDWLRSQVVSGRTRQSSVAQYAYSLRSFWGYLHSCDIAWTDVDDSVLRTWRNRMCADDDACRKVGLEKRSINHKLYVVLHFYIWAQDNNYISDVVGPNATGGRRHPISLEQVTKRGRVVFKSTVLFRITRKPRNPIPNRDETKRLFGELAKSKSRFVAERNCLLANWALGAGLRRGELLSLRAELLPSITSAYEERECSVTVVGKGGHARTIPVESSLVVDTWDYFNGERQEIIKRCSLRKDDGYLFISKATGGRLSEQYVSRIISRAFSFTNRKLSLQRLRARYTSLVVRTLREEEQARVGIAGLREETILFRAAELLGHKDLNSLAFYLNMDLDAEWRLVVPADTPTR